MSLLTQSRLILARCLACLVLVTAGVVSSPAGASEADFDSWLVELREEAMGLGISKATLDAALGDVTPQERVIELDRSQPEFNLTFDEYLVMFISDWRRNTGVKMMAEILKSLMKLQQIRRSAVTFWGLHHYGRYLAFTCCGRWPRRP